MKLTIAIILIVTGAMSAFGQTEGNSKKPQDDGQASLEGLTEAILFDGRPALRIILGRKNNSTEVMSQKRDGEDALVYDVYKNQMQGKLYVTKSRVIFDPLGAKKNYFNIEKSKIRETALNKPLPGDRFVKLYFEDEEISITLTFGDFNGVNKNALGSANTFLLRAIKDFDSAFSEFSQLTANVRNNNVDEEGKEEDTEADVNDKYDRFKDLTMVSTSRMLVRGTKHSIRIYAEYSFKEKAQKKPERISLYFYASATRPLFRDADLELNFLVDDKRVPLGELRLVDEERTKTATKQTVVVSLPYEIFVQIANGKRVEFQIGKLDYKLTDIHLETFRKLLTYKIEE